MAVNIEALEKLGEVVDNIDPKTLNMDDWVSGVNECGTVACIIGHACMNDWFKEKGLRLEDAPKVSHITPAFEDELGYSAIERFFGISFNNADRLFSGDYYEDMFPEEIKETFKTRLKMVMEGGEL